MENTYQIRDLTFAATVLLLGARLKSVTRDSVNPNTKIFHFAPAYEVEQLNRKYISGEIRLNPLQLKDTIQSLKNASIDLPKPSQICKKCGKPTSQTFDDFCSSCRQTQLYHAKNGFSAEELKARTGGGV